MLESVVILFFPIVLGIVGLVVVPLLVFVHGGGQPNLPIWSLAISIPVCLVLILGPLLLIWLSASAIKAGGGKK